MSPEGQGRLFTPDGDDVRVLTVWQPWAWATIHAGKSPENRSRYTSYRGLLLIHAGRTVDPDGIEFLRSAGITVPAEALTGGQIIGSVQLADCIRGSTSQWAREGKWHWMVEDPRPATTPLACRGQRTLFSAPPGWQRAFM